MNFSAWSIRHPVPPIALFLMLIVAGIVSFQRLAVTDFLMLMGIVTKNAIMLVEFALQAMERGADRAEAMLDAGHKRARPIIMTTVAMTAGMIPTALAHGAGGETRAPMAIAVIGGLLVSTLLSLVFVPSLFSVMEGLRSRMAAVLAWALGLERRPGAD